MPPLSQQPYFLRALYEWCVDSGLTPYLSVRVDHRTRVPQGYIKEGQIVLNLGPSAVRNLNMDNEWITFSARFGGASHAIEVPVANVLAIYARETGEGMGFASEAGLDVTGKVAEGETAAEAGPSGSDEPPKTPRGRPQLRVVK
ncbi:MAG: ClpXP protease specificity-enhancing factor [Hydrogenophilales bacterium CG17_big_fil_post_rev_8_21_14_2_50_63_12]|nr:MAG: ClpXP protease specificity-enhancing factor [Hydrogenophilales bacterium CG17_big_fil_post_rev_8_21_14_2_50_63_12]PIX98452.1 MAG: ClpXP protease specificity-enhancing factor [Hydrogenophilales bacterium CG_4_10_14_3_um_filter_63_21]